MRPAIAVLGLLLVTSCTAGHVATPAHDRGSAPIAVGQSDSRTPDSASTTPAPTNPGTTAPAPTTPAPTTAPAVASSSAPAPYTRRLVLRPVTARGTVAAGYALVRHLDEQVDCGHSFPSPAAVDRNILECSPAAAYPVACWPSRTPGTALCYRNPFAKQVDLLAAGPVVATSAPATPAPYGLLLRDGGRCTIRIGGAWAWPVGHPELSGTYSCSNGEDVWATRSSDGVNRTAALWTVLVGAASGRGPLHTVAVLSAYYVGTSSTA